MSGAVDGLLRRIQQQYGGLIELCVPGVQYRDWCAVVDALVRDRYRMTLSTAGEPVPVRTPPEKEFTDGERVDHLLKVRVGRQRWTTQFYSASLIDFQGDPEELRTTSDLDDLREFGRLLHRSTGRRTVLVPETLDPESVEPYLEFGRPGMP